MNGNGLVERVRCAAGSSFAEQTGAFVSGALEALPLAWNAEPGRRTGWPQAGSALG